LSTPVIARLPPVGPFLRRRLLTALPTLFAVVTLTFLLARLAPGGPFAAERALPEAARINLEARYGLDRPLAVQYLKFWGNVLTGRLGPSFQQPERSALGVLLSGLPPSLLVGAAALVIALLLGLGGGSLAAVTPRASPILSMLALLALAVPVFVLAPLLVQVFALWLGWLPAGQWGGPAHLVLPTLALGIPVGGSLFRFWRALVVEQLESPACLAARTRGLEEWEVLIHHAAPRALPVLINYFGPLAAGLVTGSVVVEQVFGLPGMGRFFIQGALARDYPVVIAATLLYAITLLVVHTLADLAQLRLDPRLHKAHADWVEAERERRRVLRETARAEQSVRRAAGTGEPKP
jgi:oligopeptide transport system permease protein